MATWIVGDIHGCADELHELVRTLALGPTDRLVSVGDLFHRGPDPAGVMAILRESRAAFVLGNHERAVLARCGLAPRRADAADRPPLREEFPELDGDDLRGDGDEACRVEPHVRRGMLTFLQGHAGYALQNAAIEGAGPTADGRPFVVVHAGRRAGTALADETIRDLTSLRRTSARGNPWWYESWTGPELVLFGHTPSPLPRAWRSGGKLVALGLDTGCVYGGKLTAYSPELDEFAVVRAGRAYAAKSPA